MSNTGNFLSPDSKWKRLTTYLVTTWWLFSLSADLLGRKIQVIGPEKRKQHYRDFYKIYLVLCLPQPNYPRWKWYQHLLTESQKVRGRAKKFTRVRQRYSCLPYKSCFTAFWQGKDYSSKVFSRYARWIRAFWRKYLTKYHLLMI